MATWFQSYYLVSPCLPPSHLRTSFLPRARQVTLFLLCLQCLSRWHVPSAMATMTWMWSVWRSAKICMYRCSKCSHLSPPAPKGPSPSYRSDCCKSWGTMPTPLPCRYWPPSPGQGFQGKLRGEAKEGKKRKGGPISAVCWSLSDPPDGC